MAAVGQQQPLVCGTEHFPWIQTKFAAQQEMDAQRNMCVLVNLKDISKNTIEIYPRLSGLQRRKTGRPA
jgi:hypothetical protein